MSCPNNPGSANTTGQPVPYNEFYMVAELRDLAWNIVNKYNQKVPCQNYKLIVYWVKKHVRYMTDRAQFGVSDFWLFPTETINAGAEDCDGLSFLTASLLEAIGVETRVVLGPTPFGYHAWVEFINERGEHMVVECTKGEIYTLEESQKLGYNPNIYINPNGCSEPIYDVPSY